MSLFKSQMFIEDAPVVNLDFDRDAAAFGPSYGNRVASERQFREPWSLHRREADVCPADPACASARR